MRKRQRRLDRIDEIVLSLTARGLATGEVAAHFDEVYGAKTDHPLARPDGKGRARWAMRWHHLSDNPRRMSQHCGWQLRWGVRRGV